MIFEGVVGSSHLEAGDIAIDDFSLTADTEASCDGKYFDWRSTETLFEKKKRRNKEKFARAWWKKKRWRDDGVLSRTTLIHALNLSTIHFNNYSRGRTVYLSNRPNFLNIYRRYETPLGETVVDLINARGVYLILGVQKGAFNRYKEAFKRERRFFSHVQ